MIFMSNLYEYILKSEKINEIVDSILSGNNILIVDNNTVFFNELKETLIENNIGLVELYDKNTIENNINSSFDKLNLQDGEIKRIKLLNREIKVKKELIINIFNSFIKKESGKYSLNDLYCSTFKAIEFKDKEFEYYNILKKIKYINLDNKYLWDNIQSLKSDSKIEIFLKYKKFSDNKKFAILKDKVEDEDIESAISKLSGLLNNPFAFIPPIYFNSYTNDFIDNDVYYSKNKDIFLKKVKDINQKYNGSILESKKNITLFTPQFWFKKNKIEAENKLSDETYYRKETEIRNQYEENIDNLNLFIKSYSFLNKVFKNKVLKKIQKYALNQEELMAYIESLKKTLEIYNNYLKIEKVINKINETEREILNLYYDNLENKSDLRALIEFTPNYINYLMIEKIENTNGKIIESYNDIDIEIRKLNNALQSFCKILKELFAKKQLIGITSSNIYTEKQIILDDKFKLVLDYNSIDEEFYSSVVKFNKNYKVESLDKNIIRLLSNLGYIFKEDETNSSIIYLNNNYNPIDESVLYINRDNIFRVDDLLDLVDLVSKHKKILFLWYRNWWLDKNNEIEKIETLINS